MYIYMQNHCLPLILPKPTFTFLRGRQERTKFTVRIILFGPNLRCDHAGTTAVSRLSFLSTSIP